MHVAIVGLGPSAAEFLDVAKRCGGISAYCDEVWGINSIGDCFPCTKVFHMDDLKIQETRAVNNKAMAACLKWMRTYPNPIITSRAYPDYPSSVEFPLEDVVNSLGYGYFNSTSAYAAAYAIWAGAKKISCFGLDFTYPNIHHAEKGRACLEYWLGYAAAKGIELAFPRETSLMDACEQKLYGYDTRDVHTEVIDGRVKVTYTEAEHIPTASEMEARYDHSKHPNPLVT